MTEFTAILSAGSSPRMRGTPRARPGQHMDRGIIPAYAGNTSARHSPSEPRWDHPRVCGEHSTVTGVTRVRLGSSPRMRGTRTTGHGLDASRRIIPAYAGNTTNLGRTLTLDGDHPRVCGEHLCTVRWSMQVVGSSPRMRGTRLDHFSYPASIGIIPAYAGNTCCESGESYGRRDHPRVCGEHCPAGGTCFPRQGSSPRMRGTLMAYILKSCVIGIIPAYAGNTNCRNDTGI